MTKVLLAINDARLADHLSGLIGESEELEVAGSVRDPQELRGGISRTDIDAVLVHDSRGSVSLLELVRELSVTQPDLGLVLIAGESSPEILRAGMQAGARDVLAAPFSLDALEMSVMAAAAWTQALRRRAARESGGELNGVGRVITVVGAKGGVGTTTVAVHLALAARRLANASVCLVEYDLQAGDLRSFLDLPYRRSVVDLAAVADELTTRNLQESLYTHESGMRVLLAPQEGELADQVTAAGARNILTAIRTREDLTIVDAGAQLTEAGLIAAEMADTVIVVATPDVVALRGVSRITSAWDRLKIEPAEVAVLLNRVSKRHEIQPELARRVVSVPVLDTTVPADFFALESAVNTGLASAGGSSEALLNEMGSLLGEVSALGGAEAPSAPGERRRRLAARLAGESGQATVETIGVLPLMLFAALVIWQVVLVGMTFVFAGHAARAGARALAVGEPVVSAAASGLPGAWRSGLSVHDSTNSQAIGTVSVDAKVPLLVPGFNLIPISTSASTVIEDELLNGESNPLALLSGEAGLVLDAPGVPQVTETRTTTQPDGLFIAGPTLGEGTLIPSASWPDAVKKFVWAADALMKYPYCYGGGHDASFAPSGGPDCAPGEVGYDCSGSTSFALAYAHLLSGGPLDSTGLESWGLPGDGSLITVWARGDHVHVVVDGRYDFDTNGVKNGPGWYVGSGTSFAGADSSSWASDYVHRHPPNL